MNKWTIGGLIAIIVLGGIYVMTSTSDTASDVSKDADMVPITSVAVQDVALEVSNEIEQIELEEIEADTIIDELESETF